MARPPNEVVNDTFPNYDDCEFFNCEAGNVGQITALNTGGYLIRKRNNYDTNADLPVTFFNHTDDRMEIQQDDGTKIVAKARQINLVAFNFNINTVDASGFEELLVRSRGTITQIINNAVNERGSRNLI